MRAALTYLEFLAIFLAGPIALLLLFCRVSLLRRLRWHLALVCVAAVVYTGPWDGALIANGVWTYGPGRVVGLTGLRVPLEEYCFYVLQVVLTGLVTAVVWRRLERR